MQYNKKIFEGLFDKFGEDDPLPNDDDILIPIKKELQRFFSARQRSKGKNLTCIASDYGVPEIIWEKGSHNLLELQKTLEDRLQQLDPRCKNIRCHLNYQNQRIELTVSLSLNPLWARAPVHFQMHI